MPVEIKDLTYVYSPGSPFEILALNKINLKVADGEFLGIIGHTGSGKSTLVSHLNALTRIQSGTIVVDDISLVGKADILAKKNRLGTDGKKIQMTAAEKREYKAELKQMKKKPDFRNLRMKVGMVFQYPEYQLFDETVFKDVEFGAKNMGIAEAERAERVKEAIEMVGLDFEEVKERSPFDLSGGQKRRVALAGVLVMRPNVLILDEPTAGLDPRGKKEILQLIVNIKQKMCPTIIMISHNMDEVSNYCSKIAVMANGELRCILPPKELFSQREMLAALNIQVPMVTEIACRLADRGLDIPRNIVSQTELVAAILQARRRKNLEK